MSRSVIKLIGFKCTYNEILVKQCIYQLELGNNKNRSRQSPDVIPTVYRPNAQEALTIGRSGYLCSREENKKKGLKREAIPHCLDNRFTNGGEVLSLTRRPRSTLQKHFHFSLGY
jgi:hypothetical protein